jgi:hypothetical protein
MIKEPFMPRDKQYDGLSPSPGVITDQNLLNEHAHGRLRERFPTFYKIVDDLRASLRH